MSDFNVQKVDRRSCEACRESLSGSCIGCEIRLQESGNSMSLARLIQQVNSQFRKRSSA